MEDARPTSQQPLLHMLVVFLYVVHSNKTDDLQWGLVEHRVFIQTKAHTRKVLDSLQFCI